MAAAPIIQTEAELERELARPSEADVACLHRLDGDILVLGASGKMGPSLARLCRNASDEAGRPRRIFAVSRNPAASPGIEAIRCDLLRREEIAQLPECPNILFLAGRKFGSSGSPELTWAINTVVPALVAERFPQARMVVFSTGNVYPLRTLPQGGSIESDVPGPVGEYAQSCLGRERVFQHYSQQSGLRCLIFRLNYAVDLRYGVLVDIARKVWSGAPVDVSVPAFNVVWQRDANSYALRALEHTASPPAILNVTGRETLFVRQVATWFADRFGRECRFTGSEGEVALLSDAAKCHRMLGLPPVTAVKLMEMVAAWIERGGSLLDKPTHFEVADGRF
jgi:nucleoside-diphosphate-sugar epimerase